MSEENFQHFLENSLCNGDSADLLDFIRCETNAKYIDDLIRKIGELLEEFSSSVTEKDCVVANTLQLLLDFTQAVEFDTERAIFLSKCLLFYAVDENCSITNIKRAVHIINIFLAKPSVGHLMTNEESFEGAIQILGRKIPMIGDFECQALLFEALCRFTNDTNKRQWANIWFTNEKTRSLFLHLNPEQFEQECRKTLNYINRNEIDQRVFSFVATSVFFGSLQVKKPNGSDFWIDFNYDTHGISFYCSEFNFNNEENSASWETVSIPADVVEKYELQNQNTAKSKVLCLTLKCSCSDLMMTSYDSSKFETNYVRIIFWSFLDIHVHLEKVFGKACLGSNEVSSVETYRNRKVSSSNLISFSDSKAAESHAQGYPGRKVSNSCEITPFADTEGSDKSNGFINPKQDQSKSPQKDNLECQENGSLVDNDGKDDQDLVNRAKISHSEPIRKKIKSNSSDSSISKESKRKKTERRRKSAADTAYEAPRKKPRKAAIRAKKKNKEIFEQKESLKRFEILPAGEQPADKKQISEQTFKVENTKPIKSAMKRKHSMFLTDTETGSSEVSWFGRKKSVLFESPKKSYSNRKRRNVSKGTSFLSQSKNKKQISQKSKKKSNKYSDSETKSKSAFSDLESYKLIIEKNTKAHSTLFRGKSFSNLFNASNTILTHLEPDENSKNVNVDSNQEPTSITSNLRTQVEENFNEQIHAVVSDAILHKPNDNPVVLTEKSNLEEIDASKCTDKPKILRIQPHEAIRNHQKKLNPKSAEKSNSGSKKLIISHNELSENRLKKSNIESGNLCKKEPPIKKTKLLNSSIPPTVDRDEDFNSKGKYFEAVSDYNSDNHYEELEKQIPQEFPKFASAVSNPSNSSYGTGISFLPNVSMAVKEVPSTNENNKISMFSQDKVSPKKTIQLNHEKSNLQTLNVLSQEMLKPLQDEAEGKEIHMQRFLESLSSESSPYNNKGVFKGTKEEACVYTSPLKRRHENMDSEFEGDEDEFLPEKQEEKALSDDFEPDLASAKENSKKSKKSSDLLSKHYPSHAAVKRSRTEKKYIDDFKMAEESIPSTNFTNNKKKKHYSVLSILTCEINALSRKLLCTVQKYAQDFRIKVSSLRQNIVNTAEDLLNQESDLNEKDLKYLARSIHKNRIHIQMSLKKILSVSQVYFEAEKTYNRKMKSMHKKTFKKYITSVQTAGEITTQLMEERIISEARALFKGFLGKIELM